MIHIIPINDIKPHTEESTCECCPRLEMEGGEMILIHNSYDNREEKEFRIGEKALRRSQHGHDLHETWIEFTVNYTYLEWIKENPNDVKKLPIG